uniref:Integrase catalytic domain-containing protein n=1 Tax=Latimeria chalumnae TaxID=7897 RepID=H3A350_LATCH
MTAPVNPGEKTYGELVMLVRNHQNPSPSEIVQRYKFNTCSRQAGEGVGAFVGLSEHCDYGTMLEVMLCDRLVCGINDEKIQQRLLAEPMFDFDRALDIAQGMELAAKNTQDLQAQGHQGNAICKMEACARPRKGRQEAKISWEVTKPCFCCGEHGHVPDKCKFKNEECFNFLKRGHIRSVPRNKNGEQKSESASVESLIGKYSTLIEDSLGTIKGGKVDPEAKPRFFKPSIVSGRSDEEHLQNLNQVLERLSKVGMQLNIDKCMFIEAEVTYLGHRINAEGFEKVCAIARAPEPTIVCELKSYLELLNYYGRFMPNLSIRLVPLYRLLNKDVHFTWDPEQAKAFQLSKELLQSYKVLIHYDPNKKLILSCDALPYGLGSVLSHRLQDGTERLVSFASWSLLPAEKRYLQLEKEALAVMWGVKKFHVYLFRRYFIIKNDHKPLQSLLNEEKPVPVLAAGRIQCWALILSAHEYSFQYKPGNSLGNTDAFSRLLLPDMPGGTPLPAEVVGLLEFVDASLIDLGREEELCPYYSRWEELSVQNGCILWGARIMIPVQGSGRVVDMIHEAHPGIVRMKSFTRYVWWLKTERDLENKATRHIQAKALLYPWEYPCKPWRLHIDYAGTVKGKMLLIIVDAFSRWMDVHVLNSSTAEATVEKLRISCATFSIPDTIVSDNGTCFVGEVFQSFVSKNRIKRIKVAPYHPTSNGLAEKAVQSVKEGIGKLHDGTLETKVARFLFKYRTTSQVMTGKSPAKLLFGRQIKTHLELLHPDEAECVKHQQQEQKERHDLYAKDTQFYVKAAVYVTNFSNGPCWLKGVITRKTGPVSYLVELLDGRVVHHH